MAHWLVLVLLYLLPLRIKQVDNDILVLVLCLLVNISKIMQIKRRILW